jgi:hypothetical protein
MTWQRLARLLAIMMVAANKGRLRANHTTTTWIERDTTKMNERMSQLMNHPAVTNEGSRKATNPVRESRQSYPCGQ